MPLKLYKVNYSPPALAAVMICEMHNVPVEMIDLDLSAKEHMTPEYLEKNPLHTIPLLEDDDLYLHESHVILSYLTEKYGKDESLYPKDLSKRAQIDQKLFFDIVLFTHLRSITYAAHLDGLKKPTEKQLRDIDETYGFLETFLSKTKFVAADNMTIADVSILSSMSALRHIAPIDVKYSKLNSWLTYMQNQPFFKKFAESGFLQLAKILQELLDL